MACLTCLIFVLMLVSTVNCDEYLVALAKSDSTAYIAAVTGQQNGWVSYKPTNVSESTTLGVVPYSRQLITIDESYLAGIGVENKSLIINASDDVSISGCYWHAAFSPLPVSALGAKYILPFCGATGHKSVLVIASYNQDVDVSITLSLGSETLVYNGNDYNNTDVIVQHLGPHQTFTFTFKPDVSGTVIDATSPVAVFLGSMYYDQIDTYDQLLPVSAYDNEYAIALEDDRADHKLQIASEFNDTEIYFNDGSTLKGQLTSRVFRSNDTIYFNSTRPVMSTICRRSNMVYYSTFVTVPPISSFRKEKISLYIPYSRVITSVKLITTSSADVQIERYTRQESPAQWSSIPGTQYKVGTCKIPNQYSTSFTSNDTFTILAFSYYFVQNGGYGSPLDGKPASTGSAKGLQTAAPATSSSTETTSAGTDVTQDGVEYLLAFASTFKTAHLSITTGQGNGSIEFRLPDSMENTTLELSPYTTQLVTVGEMSQAGVGYKGNGVQSKAFVVRTSDDGIAISVNYRYAASSVLPVSGLGTKYMLPFCGVNQKKSFIVIASYDQQTEVNITVRLNAETFTYNWKQYDDGNIISQTLAPYQTFVFKYEHNMTGTIIDASHPVAVFMGSNYIFDVETYEQIPPVSAYGTEYVVAAVDTPEDHKLQIISAEYDNEIQFSDGRVISSRFYSDFLQGNGTLYFTSTKPVMTTLCRLKKYRYNSGLVVVPPVSSYRNQEASLNIQNSTVKILTKANANVTVLRSSGGPIQPTWSLIAGSRYKVGTCVIPSDNSTSFKSDDIFGLLAFSEYFIQNGGY